MNSTIFFDGLTWAVMPVICIVGLWFHKRGVKRRPELAKGDFWYLVGTGAGAGIGTLNFLQWLVTPDKSRLAHSNPWVLLLVVFGALSLAALVIFLIKRKYEYR